MQSIIKLNMEASTILFIEPSPLRGFARNVDLFGHLDDYNFSENADALAFASDVKAVAEDFNTAIDILDDSILDTKQSDR